MDMEPDKNIQEEMDSLAPGFPKRPFHAPPSGYFQQLPDQLMEQWQIQNAITQSKYIHLPRMISAAAIVAGICFGVMWLSHRSIETPEASGISSSDAYQYIIDNLDEFEPLILQQELWIRNDKNATSESSAIEEFLIEELDGDDIETIF